MKIDLIIASLRGGGAERVMVILANSLCARGYDVSIITFSPEMDFDLNPGVSLVKLHNGKIPNHSIRRFINLMSYYKEKNKRPQIIVSFITQINLISIIAAKTYGIKIICSEHNSYLRAQWPLFLTKLTRKWFYPKADVVTVLTAFDIPYYRSLNVNVEIMPNPCSFKPIEKLNYEKEKAIIAVGSLDRYHHKGFDNLVDIAKNVLASRPAWKLKIVGKGETGMAFLEEKVNAGGLSSNITLMGFRTDVSQIMAKSEIFVLPSRYEGLPMVLLEAMSQGMACIAYDCKTGPADIITNGFNGLLIEDQNKEKMIESLSDLMDNEELRNNLSKNGIKSVDKFSLKSITDKWVNLFEKIKV